jgi:hypothetical protein
LERQHSLPGSNLDKTGLSPGITGLLVTLPDT